MNVKNAMRVITVLAFAGMLFSGYLTYGEFTTSGGLSCTVTSAHILGLPVCVYGLAMYFLIFIVAILGMRSAK